MPHAEFAARPLQPDSRRAGFTDAASPRTPQSRVMTTAAPTFAVTHKIVYHSAPSRFRVLILTDDLAEAEEEVQARNDAAYEPYGAWILGHDQVSNYHDVYELVWSIDYTDWSSFPSDLFEVACAILEDRKGDPDDDDYVDPDDAVDAAAAELEYVIAMNETGEGGSECFLLRSVGSDS